MEEYIYIREMVYKTTKNALLVDINKCHIMDTNNYVVYNISEQYETWR